jgi:two-component system sensor histidine kinase KdpD
MLVQIRNQAQALQQLVDNLLAMARLQQGGVQLKREWLPVDELVGSALAQMRERLAAHVLQTSLPADLPLLQLDAVLMERVLVNLLDNAIKYTPEGTTITVAASVADGDCVLSVQDAGPGLPVHLSPSNCSSRSRVGRRRVPCSAWGSGWLWLSALCKPMAADCGWRRQTPGRAPFSACTCPCPSSRPWTNEPTIPCITCKSEHDKRRTPHLAD